MTAVHVAVGVIHRGGRILLSRRHADSHQGGLWEFPGGKVESGEQVTEALQRELEEELGIRVQFCEPLLEVRHDYGDKQVFLDVWWVSEFSGKEQGREGQPLSWVAPEQLQELEFPAANEPIVEAVLSRLNESR
jgi:8-oxo-dGTP diphosphatase